MAEKGIQVKNGGRYPRLREFLTKDFGSLRKFAKESGLPATLLTQVLKGKPNYDRAKNRARIADAIRRLRPDADLTGIWQRPAIGAPEDAALRRHLRQNRIQRAIELEEETRI